MAKNFDKFNKFCNQYDLHADGIEEEVIQFLKGKFPKAFNAAKKDLLNDNGGDEEELPSPGSIYAYLSTTEDSKFFKLLEEWFKENYPDDELKQ